jgi:hypothetical protein
MTSVGKNAVNKAVRRAIFSSLIKSLAILYISRIFASEKTIGKIIVANSFVPKIIIENEVKPMNAILRGNTG